MKTLIWILFDLSILGMFASAALRYAAVREAIVETWVIATQRLETISPSITVQLFGNLISAFYLKGSTSISKKKILLLSSLASLVWATFMQQCMLSKSFGEASTWMCLLFFTLINMPSHFVFEYLQAIFLVRIFQNNSNKKPLIILVRLLILYISILGVSFLAFLVFRSSRNFAILRVAVLFPIATPVLIPYAVFFRPDALHLGQLFILPFTITYVGGIILLCFSAVVTNSKPFLRLLCWGVDRLSASAYTSIFHVSMILFAIATGAMQAYSF